MPFAKIFAKHWYSTENKHWLHLIFHPWINKMFYLRLVGGCYWTEGQMPVDQTSHLHPAPHFAPTELPRKRHEPTRAAIVIVSTPPPQTLCLTIAMVCIFSPDVCLLFMYVLEVCASHAHHLDHKVSSVLGTWVLWSASSSLWSARWWLWSNRQNSIFNVRDHFSGSHTTHHRISWTY